MKLLARNLYQEGENLRERDKHLQALRVLDEALIKSQQEKNYKILVDVLKARVLTWKHLFLLTQDPVYRIIANKEAESMLDISKEYNLKDKLHTSYFRLGEVMMLYKDYPKAITNYQKALRAYKGSLSEKGDYRYHLGEALYRNGQKKRGKLTILKGLKEIVKGKDKIDPFVLHVWESGVHMRLADLLKEDEPDEARKHLLFAQEIARSDKKLVIRRRQIRDLAKTFRD